jgi:hypothetical protein
MVFVQPDKFVFFVTTQTLNYYLKTLNSNLIEKYIKKLNIQTKNQKFVFWKTLFNKLKIS